MQALFVLMGVNLFLDQFYGVRLSVTIADPGEIDAGW